MKYIKTIEQLNEGKVTELGFWKKLSKAQQKTLTKLYKRDDSRNFRYSDNVVSGIFGPSYDISHFDIQVDGTYFVYGK
jgi:hypothetical protein